MSPAAIIALARDIALVVGIGLLLWLVYRGGEDRAKASDLKSLQTEIQQQAKTLSDWRSEATHANEQLSKDVSAINAARDIPVQHVWVRDTACPKPAVLPAATGQAGDLATPTGAVQPGAGEAAATDRRDGIVGDFKQKWEIILAQCRALDAQWPN